MAESSEDAHSVEASLTADGHIVTSCNDRSGGPCRGVEHFDDCPLESPVDLAVIARSSHGRRSIEEMGSVCASRHRVGVVEIDPSVPDERSIYDLADAAEHAICRGYEAAIRHSATDLYGDLCADGSFDVVVVRRHGDVHVKISLETDASPTVVGALADRARAATRRHDRFAQVIDVAVQHNRLTFDPKEA